MKDEKTNLPIDVKLSMCAIYDNDLQFEKADLPIYLTLFESVFDINEMQHQKA